MKHYSAVIPVRVKYDNYNPLLNDINPDDGSIPLEKWAKLRYIHNEKTPQGDLFLLIIGDTQEGGWWECIFMTKLCKISWFQLFLAYMLGYIGYRTYPYLDKVIDKLVELIKQNNIYAVRIGRTEIFPRQHTKSELKEVIKGAINNYLKERFKETLKKTLKNTIIDMFFRILEWLDILLEKIHK